MSVAARAGNLDYPLLPLGNQIVDQALVAWHLPEIVNLCDLLTYLLITRSVILIELNEQNRQRELQPIQ
jgi:hypothetical protein